MLLKLDNFIDCHLYPSFEIMLLAYNKLKKDKGSKAEYEHLPHYVYSEELHGYFNGFYASLNNVAILTEIINIVFDNAGHHPIVLFHLTMSDLPPLKYAPQSTWLFAEGLFSQAVTRSKLTI